VFDTDANAIQERQLSPSSRPAIRKKKRIDSDSDDSDAPVTIAAPRKRKAAIQSDSDSDDDDEVNAKSSSTSAAASNAQTASTSLSKESPEIPITKKTRLEGGAALTTSANQKDATAKPRGTSMDFLEEEESDSSDDSDRGAESDARHTTTSNPSTGSELVPAAKKNDTGLDFVEEEESSDDDNDPEKAKAVDALKPKSTSLDFVQEESDSADDDDSPAVPVDAPLGTIEPAAPTNLVVENESDDDSDDLREAEAIRESALEENARKEARQRRKRRAKRKQLARADRDGAQDPDSGMDDDDDEIVHESDEQDSGDERGDDEEKEWNFKKIEKDKKKKKRLDSLGNLISDDESSDNEDEAPPLVDAKLLTASDFSTCLAENADRWLAGFSSRLMVAFYSDFYVDKLGAFIFDQLIAVVENDNFEDEATATGSVLPSALVGLSEEQRRAIRFSTKLLLFVLGDSCAPAGITGVHRRLLPSWGPAQAALKVVAAGQNTAWPTAAVPEEVVTAFSQRLFIVAQDEDLNYALAILQRMMHTDGGGIDSGAGARATLALRKTVPPPTLDERLAWLIARHPVVRRLALRYVVFAVRNNDLPRVQQLLDIIWFVDTTHPSEDETKRAVSNASKVAHLNAAADGAVSSGAPPETVTALKAAADAAIAELAYARPSDMETGLMPDIVLQNVFFDDLSKAVGQLAGSREDEPASLVLYILDKFLKKQVHLLDEAVSDSQLTVRDAANSANKQEDIDKDLAVAVPLKMSYQPALVILHGCITQILRGTVRVLNEVCTCNNSPCHAMPLVLTMCVCIVNASLTTETGELDSQQHQRVNANSSPRSGSSCHWSSTR